MIENIKVTHIYYQGNCTSSLQSTKSRKSKYKKDELDNHILITKIEKPFTEPKKYYADM